MDGRFACATGDRCALLPAGLALAGHVDRIAVFAKENTRPSLPVCRDASTLPNGFGALRQDHADGVLALFYSAV